MSKVTALVNVRIEIEPPRIPHWMAPTMERRAKELDSWAHEFEEFVRDHRSQDPVRLNVIREQEEQCSLCGSKWEEDADGPLCCTAAQEEWDTARAAAAGGEEVL